MAATSTTSKFIALFPQTQKHKTLIPSTQKTHLSYPLSCPSISLKAPENTRNRNELFITSMGTYNVQVIVEENEHEERLLSRFRREVMRAGVIQESKRRRFFENPHDKKKRKSREAAKRNSKRFDSFYFVLIVVHFVCILFWVYREPDIRFQLFGYMESHED